jgi:hypothetical protein
MVGIGFRARIVASVSGIESGLGLFERVRFVCHWYIQQVWETRQIHTKLYWGNLKRREDLGDESIGGGGI